MVYLTDLQLLFSFNSSFTSIYTDTNSCHLSLYNISNFPLNLLTVLLPFGGPHFYLLCAPCLFDLLPSFVSPYQEISKKTNLISFLCPLDQHTIFQISLASSRINLFILFVRLLFLKPFLYYFNITFLIQHFLPNHFLVLLGTFYCLIFTLCLKILQLSTILTFFTA